MSELVILLEEPSAKAMLEGLLPRLLPDGHPVRYIVFEGKQDMEKQLVRRLRGYLVPDARFVVLRDKDAADCHQVKAKLLELCRKASKPDALVRVACHEIESWYLADLAAVERGLQLRGLAPRQDSGKYSAPDTIVNPAEELVKLTKHLYQKVGGSRLIGPFLALDNKRSKSFGVFVEGVRRLIGISGDRTE